MLAALLSAMASAQDAPPAVVTEVHRSEVDVVTPHAHVLPEPAPAYVRCVVRVVIDGEGLPISADPSKCEEPYAARAAEAALSGRWRLREGQTAPLAFQVPVDARPIGRPDYLARPRPELPEDLPDAREYECAGYVGFDAQGRSDYLHFTTECPEPARAEVIRALGLWLIVAPQVDGQATPVLEEFDYVVDPDPPEAATPGPDGAVLSHSELKVRRRVRPKYPVEALGVPAFSKPEGVDCKVRIYIDETGTPYDLRFEGCPLVFHASAREAVMRWRWKPAQVNGEIVKAQFLLNVKYKVSP
jgi:hypothetical protein